MSKSPPPEYVLSNYTMIQESPNVKVYYLSDPDLCKYHETSPMQMKNTYLAYHQLFQELIDFYCLDEVKINFRIDGSRGAGIDSFYDMQLRWDTVPQGFVSIFLGSWNDNHKVPLLRRKHTLGHELVHVLIFAYFTSVLNLPTKWIGFSHRLPSDCKIHRLYIELLCDTLSLLPQRNNLEYFMNVWREEWDKKNYATIGVYYFSEDVEYALDFIESHVKSLSHYFDAENSEITKENIWIEILDRFFKTEESKKWMDKAVECFSYKGKK